MNRVGVSLRRDGSAPADLYLDATGNLAMVYDTQAIGQHARQRLMTYEGEWFLDKDVGVPWLRDIMGRQYDPVLAESVVKTCILETDGVTEITSFSVRFSRETRGVTAYDIDVLTIFDEVISL